MEIKKHEFTDLELGTQSKDFYNNGDFFTQQTFINKDDSVIDIGSGEGVWSKSLLASIPVRMLIAVDPVRDLCANLYEKHFFREEFRIVCNVFGSENSENAFYVDKKDLKNSSIVDLSNLEKEIEKIPHFTISFDNFFEQQKFEKINYVNIDTNGSEFQVIKGMSVTLSKKLVDYVSFNYTNNFKLTQSSLKDCYEIFTNNDYVLFKIFERGLLWISQWSDYLETYKDCRYIAISSNKIKELGLTLSSEKIKASINISSEPLVSIIVPTYNRPDYLQTNLQTLLSQTYDKTEIIVVNDCGIDVLPIIEKFNTQKIILLNNSNNIGLGGTRNVGLNYCKGDYVSFIDDDDGAFPYHIQTLMDIVNYSKSKVVYSNAVRYHQKKDDNGKPYVTYMDIPYSIDFDRDNILVQNISPVTCFLSRKDIIFEAGLFDESLKRYEDWDMWIKLSRKHNMLHIPYPTCYYTWRDDGSSMSSTKDDLFTTLIPTIYERYKSTAVNKEYVEELQNKVLVARGLKEV